MKTVVITGSSRGIGFGLAKSFLIRGCEVVISGSTRESTEAAFDKLVVVYPPERVFGIPCDVRDYDQVKALWDGAVSRFGSVDIWINNAGLSGPVKELWEQNPETVKQVIETNLLGVVHGSKVAMKGMLAQNHGSIYSMEGMGSDGTMHTGLTLYGMTKYGLRYLNDALTKEVLGTPIIIGSIRPGMVVTDLILDQYRDKPEAWKKVKRIFNIIADRVENVTPFLVDQILSNEKSGKRITYLSRWGLFFRFLSAPFTKRDVFSKTGL